MGLCRARNKYVPHTLGNLDLRKSNSGLAQCLQGKRRASEPRRLLRRRTDCRDAPKARGARSAKREARSAKREALSAER